MLHLQRYNKFIAYYQQNPKDGFVEKHHIVPKCMGGDNSPANLVLLPTRVHFIVHYLLHKAYPENRSLAHAFAMMGVCNDSQNRSSKLYEKSKLARSNALRGVPRPEWVREKLRKPKANTENYKGTKTLRHKNSISAALKGKSKSKESIENSVKAKENYFKNLRAETEKRKNNYRTLFLESNLTRNQFYKNHPELSSVTLKRYLRGL